MSNVKVVGLCGSDSDFGLKSDKNICVNADDWSDCALLQDGNTAFEQCASADFLDQMTWYLLMSEGSHSPIPMCSADVTGRSR